MEQTLGKRIAENRKRIKLTQDQLAERLGITAQAVSKWENDQSCPDITMLPKLAGIFGITTDTLLGMETPSPVHEAEVLNEPEDDESGIHVHWNSDDHKDNGWEFHWDSGKRGAMCFAVLVLLVGVLTLLSRICDWDVSFWGILWPSALLVYGLDGMLKKFSFFTLGCTLFGGYFLIDNLGFLGLNIGNELFFPIIIVLLGLSLLVDALRKPNKPTFSVTHHGSDNDKTKYTCSNDGSHFNCNLSFGEKTHQVDMETLAGGMASVSFGELTVDLSGCQAVSDGCTVDAKCSFGELNLLVPRRFRVKNSTSTAFASAEISGHPDPEPVGIINLNASASFGEISIRYI